MPAESRQKQLSFNTTEQSEPFSINWKNIVLSKKLGSTHYRLVCSGHCKSLQTTFQSPSTSILPSHNKPKIQQGVSSHKTGSKFSSLERCNKADSQVSSKICVPSVHFSKTSGGLRPVINLKPLNQHLHTFKMEGLEGSLRAQRLYDDNRSVRRLYDSSYRGRLKKLFVFPISRSNVSILCPSIWSQRCSKSIYKNSETSSRTLRSLGFKLVVYLDDIILAASTRELCIYQGLILKKSSENLGFVINLEKSNLVPSQVVLFSRLYCGLKENVLFTSRFKDSINRSECPDCSPRSTASLQIDPKSVDKHSKISAHHTTELRCENMSEQSVKKRFDLVGKKFENQLLKTDPPSTSGSFNYVRCLRSSLGSSPRICKNSGFLEKLSVFLAHKQKGVKSSLSGIKIALRCELIVLYSNPL